MKPAIIIAVAVILALSGGRYVAASLQNTIVGPIEAHGLQIEEAMNPNGSVTE